MAECWMYGKDAMFEVNPICGCCQRAVVETRRSQWHGITRMCKECFIAWYDPDDPIDVTDPTEVGDYVRRKHGLPPLQVQP